MEGEVERSTIKAFVAQGITESSIPIAVLYSHVLQFKIPDFHDESG